MRLICPFVLLVFYPLQLKAADTASTLEDPALKVETYVDGDRKLNEGVSGSFNASTIKEVVPYYDQTPKEQSYKESELRSKAHKMMADSSKRAEDKNLSEEERSEAASVALIKESYVDRPRFDEIDRENWVKKSDLITKNPLIGVESDCKVSGVAEEEVKVEAEAYEVEVDAVREVESEEMCEEDGTELNRCESKLKLKCEKKKECGGGSIIFKDTKTKKYIPDGTEGQEYISKTSASLKWEDEGKNTIFISTNVACNFVNSRHEHTATFEVKNKEAFSKFVITLLEFGNSRVAFYLNDKEIYDEPRSALTGERQKYWYHYGVIDFKSDKNIDLLPYLKEGTNTILIKENGRIHCAPSYYLKSSSIRIETAKHKCCSSWQESWEESCGK